MKLLILSYITAMCGATEFNISLRKEALDSGIEIEIAYSNNLKNDQAGITEIFNNKIIKQIPNLTDAVFNVWKKINSLGIVNKFTGEKLVDYIKDNNIDIIICCHEYAMQRASVLKSKHQLNIPCFGLVTNYFDSGTLKNLNLDGYFLPNQEVFENFKKAGIETNKLYVTGLPISEKFLWNISKIEARNYLAIPTDKKIYLVHTEGMNDKNIISLCVALSKNMLQNSIAIVLLDRYSNAIGKLENNLGKNSNINIVIFNDKINYYMNAADVLISKPISYLQTEASSCKIPVVHVFASSDYERKNAQILEDERVSAFAQNEDIACEMANEIIRDKDIIDEINKNSEIYIIQNGARNIIEIIKNLKKE